jgi:hypothetical protein
LAYWYTGSAMCCREQASVHRHARPAYEPSCGGARQRARQSTHLQTPAV